MNINVLLCRLATQFFAGFLDTAAVMDSTSIATVINNFLIILLSIRLLFCVQKILLFPQTVHKQITEIFNIFTESVAHREPSAGIN